MDCGSARKRLWPPERPRVCRDEIVEARRHVESCEACADFFAQDRRLLEALERARDVSAPAHVREKVWDVLAAERSSRAGRARLADRSDRPVARPGRRTLVSASVVLALIVAAVPTTFVLMRSDASSAGHRGGRVFLEDYLRRAVGEDYIESSNPREVAHFLTRELGLPLDPLRVDGFEIARAEICLVDGLRGAMVVYRDDSDRTLSHYMVPRPQAGARAPARLTRETPVTSSGVASPTVVTWSDGEMEQALVGDVDARALVGFARSGRGRPPER